MLYNIGMFSKTGLDQNRPVITLHYSGTRIKKKYRGIYYLMTRVFFASLLTSLPFLSSHRQTFKNRTSVKTYSISTYFHFSVEVAGRER